MSTVEVKGGQSSPRMVWLDEGSLFSGEEGSIQDVAEQGVVLHGPFHSRAIAERIRAVYRIPDGQAVCINSASGATAQALLAMPAVQRSTIILAIGGGRVQDTAKYVAALANKPLVVLPTLIATDGVASPVAVLKGEHGESVSHGAVAPQMVLLCRALFASVPIVYWQALVGDVIGNLVAVRDVRRFAMANLSQDDKSVMEGACSMAEHAAQTILEYDRQDLADECFRKTLIQCAIDSSHAMLAAGTSLPCSGAEHLLSHAIDYLQIPPGWLHGQQVGAAVPFCLSLHEAEESRRSVIQLYHRLGMATSLQALGEAVEQQLETIICHAPDMRAGRHTILEQFGAEELLHRIKMSQ